MHTITIQLTIKADTPAKPEHVLNVVEGMVRREVARLKSEVLTIEQETIEHEHDCEEEPLTNDLLAHDPDGCYD